MDKAFENMDKRFKNIEDELNYQYDSSLWNDVEGTIEDTALDVAFMEATKAAAFTTVDFNGLEDAFLDDAFIESANSAKTNYQSSYFNDFKAVESELYQNDSFVSAASMASVTYQSEYWNDADLALQKEGLHHEYKSNYWKEAEKLLLKDERKAFFLKWGSVATVLLLLSFASLQFNNLNSSNNQFALTDSEVSLNKVDMNASHISISKHHSDTKNKSKISNIDTNQLAEISVSKKGETNSNSPNNPSFKHGAEDYSSNENSVVNELAKNNLPLVENTIEESFAKTEYSFHAIEKKGQNDQGVVNANSNMEKLNRNNEFYLVENKAQTNVILSPVGYFPKINTKHVIGIKVEKGLGNNFGNKSGALSSRNAIFVDYRFNPIKKLKRVNFGVDLGLYHMNLSNLEYEQNYSIHHIEGYVDHSWYKMTYKDLVFMSTNFNTYLDFGKSSTLRLGLGIDNLVTSRIAMEYQQSEDVEKTNAGTDWGLNRGINKFDLNLGVGYEIKLNQKFSFLMDTKIGLRDKTNNAYLKNNSTNRDVSLLLGLKYNIFTHH